MIRRNLHQFLALNLPERVKVLLYRGWQSGQRLYLSTKEVDYHSSKDNIYHCSLHKAASQWIKSILFDPTVYQYSGLMPWNRRVWGIETRSYFDRNYQKTFPGKRIISTLFINYETFMNLNKPEEYGAFFIGRDPRDIVVSYYYSIRDTHTPMGDIQKRRSVLKDLSVEDGLLYTINYLDDYGLFAALKSWIEMAGNNQNTVLIRYEDLMGKHQLRSFITLFDFCDIKIPEDQINYLLQKYSFSRMKAQKGDHYRKGVGGDWKNYFNERVDSVFNEIAGDVLGLYWENS